MKIKRILWLSLGGLALAGTLSTTAVLATSCSSTANPYFPSTTLNVTIGGKVYSYEFLNQQQNGFFVIDKTTNTKQTIADLSNKVAEFKGSNNQLIWSGSQSAITSDPKYSEYCNLISELNYASFSSQVFSYLYTMYSNMVQILARTPLGISPVLNQTNISQYYTNVANNTLNKELLIGILQGIGNGSNRYSIGIKEINMTLDVPTLEKPAAKEFSHDDPNSYAKTITVSQFNMKFSWFLEKKTGGQWVNDLVGVNKKLTASDQELLRQNGISNAQIQNLYYNVNFASQPISFNAIPSYRSLETGQNQTVYLFSGQYVFTPKLILNPNYNANKDKIESKWQTDPYAYCYTMFGLSQKNMYYIFNTISNNSFLSNKFVENNKNYLSWETYLLIWKIGYFSTNVNEDNNSNNYKTALSNITKNKFSNQPNTQTWSILQNDQNYKNGITKLYENFKSAN